VLSPTQVTSTSRSPGGSSSIASATARFSTIALAANAAASAQEASATPRAATVSDRRAAVTRRTAKRSGKKIRRANIWRFISAEKRT